MKRQDLPTIRNAQATPCARLPTLSGARFRDTVLRAIEGGSRVSALLTLAPDAASPTLLAVLADDLAGHLALVQGRLEPGEAFRAMTPHAPEVHLFERELAESGVRVEGHPHLEPVRASPPAATRFVTLGGDGHEVAVGPVHAGIIEPGHFRFQCLGEDVLQLEIALGYQHRGVERAMVSSPHGDPRRRVHYAETLAGDTTVGHGTAHALVMEALAATPAPPRGQAIRGIGLELERLANHVGDLGALANDVAFLPTASYCGRLRGDFLNLTALVCGSRFGRGLVRPGGVGFDLDAVRRDELLDRLRATRADLRSAIDLLWSASSVLGRFQETGRLTRADADQLGLVGPAARATGAERDVRKDFAFDLYRFVHVPTANWHTGDVFARAYVRHLEIEHALAYVEDQLLTLPAGPTRVAAPLDAALARDHLAVALVEGWRGELVHLAVTDADGRLARYKVVDPSFHNWQGLAHALRDQAISDFPLCNKSFNLSYAGHDL